jgi:nicotinate-nucleotide adenylyltransferase
MLYLAIEGWEGLGISTFEIAQGGLHYTIDTLRALRTGMAQFTPVFLLGSDALADLGSWREPESLLAEFDFGVAVRPEGDDGPQPRPWPAYIRRRIAPMPEGAGPAVGAGGRVFQLAIPTVAISSSLVRHARADGAPLDDLVPARVAGYIRRHGLYLEEARR